MRANNRAGGQEKGCLNVQAYMDVRKVATIAAFMLGRGELYAPQYGQVSQYCMNYFMSILEEYHADKIQRFETVSEALHWLDEHRFSMAQFSNQNNPRLGRALERESESREEFGMPTYGNIQVLKSSRAEPQAYTVAQLEQIARELYYKHGTLMPGYAYLFEKPVIGEDTSEIIPGNRGYEKTPEEVIMQNWENAKSMARMILDGTKSMDGPECKPFAALIEDAIKEVLEEKNTEQQRKEDIRKIDMKAALLAGPAYTVD